MPKKKGKKKTNNADFTLNDCANALKPVGRVKKSFVSEDVPEKTWEDLEDDDLDVIEEVNADGTKNFVYKKKRNHSKCENISDQTGIVYPEIVWYLISPYIKPEEVGNFARINRATYAITKRESFWRALYRRYCQNHPKLPEKLRIENSYKLYGLRQRVIRALHHTYDVFVRKILQQATQESRPHQLVKRRCVNVWYCKGQSYWFIYFKLKKSNLEKRITTMDFIEELGRIDANPEVDSQVMQVTCQNFYEVPPLMGMTLSSVSVVLSQGFRHHKLLLGFNTGHYNISRNVIPECSVVIDTVVSILVYDWWHPKYPNFENRLPTMDEESLPVLKKDFFTLCNGDL
ncbi:transmembrane protein 183 [Vanessa atalanta]|uniref:transmembrane protein 183 n=1 Tax=Vanessa atalanta TaxID=42275 RepID=UPI001FCE0102|nr:transmembrane protein 183 [Vanessa atalanta]